MVINTEVCIGGVMIMTVDVDLSELKNILQELKHEIWCLVLSAISMAVGLDIVVQKR